MKHEERDGGLMCYVVNFLLEEILMHPIELVKRIHSTITSMQSRLTCSRGHATLQQRRLVVNAIIYIFLQGVRMST